MLVLCSVEGAPIVHELIQSYALVPINPIDKSLCSGLYGVMTSGAIDTGFGSGFSQSLADVVAALASLGCNSERILRAVLMAPDLRALWKQIHEDWSVHGGDWTKPGFRALATHRLGNWVVVERRSRITRKVLWFFYLALYRYIRNHYGIEVYYTTKIGRRVVFGHQSGIVIHPKSEIGDDCLIRQNVTIGAVSDVRYRDAPKLGAGVSVGCGAVIVGNVTIGDGAIIGPNTVVMTDVPAGARVFAESPRIMQLPIALMKMKDSTGGR